MQIALYGRTIEANRSEDVVSLVELLRRSGVKVWMYEKLYHFIHSSLKSAKDIILFSNHHEIKGKIDFLLSLGGDGTLLETLDLVRDSGIPVAGINTGRLGFLATISKQNFTDAVNAMLKGKYETEEKSLLMVESSDKLFGDMCYALNDITIQKKDSSAMITIHTWLNDVLLNNYIADGLIIATPTGSTAYSLSCGGPLVSSGADVFVITPIAPHNLNVRPVVIPDNGTLKLQVEGRSNEFLVSLDSRTATIDSSHELLIRKAPFGMKLVAFPGQDFFSTLRNKLLWGLDKRN